jgi:hypothetical protein
VLLILGLFELQLLNLKVPGLPIFPVLLAKLGITDEKLLWPTKSVAVWYNVAEAQGEHLHLTQGKVVLT